MMRIRAWQPAMIALMMIALMWWRSRIAASMRLAEDGGEGDRKNLAAQFVGAAQLPAAPVFCGRGHQKGAHETLGLGIGLGEIADGKAAPGTQDVAGAGAVEKHFSHVPPPSDARARAIAVDLCRKNSG